MTNFEKITASPDVLGEFLASLPVATGPWDEEFHRAFCDSCELLECRPETCPHKGGRPLWWLMMGNTTKEKGERRMELTRKGNDLLDKAEDVILQGVERLLEMQEKMTGEDCRNLQTLVCTAGRIQAIRNGNFHSNYPD